MSPSARFLTSASVSHPSAEVIHRGATDGPASLRILDEFQIQHGAELDWAWHQRVPAMQNAYQLL